MNLLYRSTKMGGDNCVNDCQLSTKCRILKIENTPNMLYLEIKEIH